jgi:hypothetical protein
MSSAMSLGERDALSGPERQRSDITGEPLQGEHGAVPNDRLA